MRALILASGEGTRLKPLTEKTNKGMLLVDGKPIFEHIINHLKKYGYKDIIMTVGVKKEQVMNYFKDGSDFGVKIQYSISDEVQGTAGEIAKAKNFLENEDNFILYYGDTLSGINLNIMEKIHDYNNSIITTPVIKGIPAETSLIKSSEDGKILQFIEKPIISQKANIPIFIVNQKIFSHKNISFGKDFSADVIPDFVRYGRVFEYDESKMYNFIDYSNIKLSSYGNYHYDVGTLKRYDEVKKVFDENKVGKIKIIK